MEGWWFPNCLCGRDDSTHLGDEKCVPFHTIGAAHMGKSCVILTIFGVACFYSSPEWTNIYCLWRGLFQECCGYHRSYKSADQIKASASPFACFTLFVMRPAITLQFTPCSMEKNRLSCSVPTIYLQDLSDQLGQVQRSHSVSFSVLLLFSTGMREDGNTFLSKHGALLSMSL